MLKRLSAVSLLVSLISAQPLEVALPDSTVWVGSAAELERLVKSWLQSDAAAGDLDRSYELKRVADGNSADQAAYKLSPARGTLPPPDSVLVFIDGVRSGSQLADRLLLQNSGQDRLISYWGEPIWRVESVEYFLIGSIPAAGYATVNRLTDIARRQVQIVAGYEERAGSRGNLVGDIHLHLPNISGTLRSLSIDFRRLTDEDQTMRLQYTEPQLPLVPLGVRLAFSQESRDQLYLQREMNLQVAALPQTAYSIAVGLGRKRVTITADSSAAGVHPYTESNINAAGSAWHFNRAVNATSGYGWDWAISAGQISGADYNRNTILRTKLDVNWVIGGQKFGAVTLAQRFLFTGVSAQGFIVQAPDLIRLGGSQTLRGYFEEQFHTPWGAILRTELRQPFTDRNIAHLFVDFGYLDPGTRPLSGGVGFSLFAGSNRIQVDFGWNREDSFRTGKVHLRVSNLF